MDFYYPKSTLAQKCPPEETVEGIKKCYVVGISEKEYELCKKHSEKRKSNSKKGIYGNGLLTKSDDVFRAARVGLLGEMAFAKVFDEAPVDFMYRENGDDCDFVLRLSGDRRVRVDVKNAASNYEANWITVENEFGREMELKSDVYVCSFVMKDVMGEKDRLSVAIVGWQTRKFIKALPTVTSNKRDSKHKVKKLYYRDLHPIQTLFDLYYLEDDTYLRKKMKRVGKL